MEAAKKVLFLVVRSLRGLGHKEKITFLNLEKKLAAKVEVGGFSSGTTKKKLRLP